MHLGARGFYVATQRQHQRCEVQALEDLRVECVKHGVAVDEGHRAPTIQTDERLVCEECTPGDGRIRFCDERIEDMRRLMTVYEGKVVFG